MTISELLTELSLWRDRDGVPSELVRLLERLADARADIKRALDAEGEEVDF